MRLPIEGSFVVGDVSERRGRRDVQRRCAHLTNMPCIIPRYDGGNPKSYQRTHT